MIKAIDLDEFDDCYDLIVEAFRDIAEDLNATPENCPGNSAFMTKEKFKRASNKMTLYGYYGDDLLGCIGLIKKSDVSFKIKMLSVKPNFRHQGIGRQLIEHVEALSFGKITLGMIYENQLLYEWYLSLGYSLDKKVTYKGNRFHVAYMEKKIEKNI